jgi:hypothetical protein
MNRDFVMLAQASIHRATGTCTTVDAGLRQHDWEV